MICKICGGCPPDVGCVCPRVWKDGEIGEMCEYGYPGPREFVEKSAYDKLGLKLDEAQRRCRELEAKLESVLPCFCKGIK